MAVLLVLAALGVAGRGFTSLAETVVLLSSLALVLLAATSLLSRLASLTLADFFLLGIALFFGAYTLIDLAVNEHEFWQAGVVARVFLQVGGAR
jgi:hypothetical protein